MEQEQHQSALGTSSSIKPEITAKYGWSWAGFMFEPVIIVGTKNYHFLWFYLLMFVPLINFFFIIGFKIYMALKAREIVATCTAFKNDDERRGFIGTLDRVGYIFFIVGLVLMILWMLIMFVILPRVMMNSFLENGGQGARIERNY